MLGAELVPGACLPQCPAVMSMSAARIDSHRWHHETQFPGRRIVPRSTTAQDDDVTVTVTRRTNWSSGTRASQRVAGQSPVDAWGGIVLDAEERAMGCAVVEVDEPKRRK